MTSRGHREVHVHDFQAFRCTNCGRCCKSWRVNIDPQQFLEIAGSQAYEARAREGYVPLENIGDGLAKLGDRGDGACDFLDASAMCSLHSELGGLAKPLGCQLYPYQVMDTPMGEYVHLSFGCPPVVAGLDRDVEANRRELSLALSRRHEAGPGMSPDQLVRLSEHQSISWASYLDLEERILDAYSVSDPVDSIVRIVLSIIRASNGRAGAGRPGWPALEAATLEEIGLPQEVLFKYLGLLVDSLEAETDDEARGIFLASIQGGKTVSSERFIMDLPPLCLGPPGERWILETYQRYFRNAVLGKSLLKTTVLSRLLATASAIALVGYYAEAFRHARCEALVNLQSLTDAFEIVEVGIVTHTKLTEPFFSDLERIFEKIASLP